MGNTGKEPGLEENVILTWTKNLGYFYDFKGKYKQLGLWVWNTKKSGLDKNVLPFL